MSINVTAPLVVAVVGVIVYALVPSTSEKPSKIGYAMFCAGMLAALLGLR
jgi:hypothetical protein